MATRDLEFGPASARRIASAMQQDPDKRDWMDVAGGDGTLLAESMRRLESLFVPERRTATGEPARSRASRWY